MSTNSGIPSMMTHGMKARMKARGYSAEEILHMPLEEVHEILSKPTPQENDADVVAPPDATTVERGLDLLDLPALVHLKSVAKWVAWELVPRNDEKPAKVPICPHTGRYASVDDPTSWGTYDQALARARRNDLPGVGFVLTPDDGLTGADLDDVRNPETGELAPWAAEIIALAETYTEVSPSGTGLRILWEGKIDASIKCLPKGVEIYRDGRFLTITGAHVAGTPDAICPAPKTEAALCERANDDAPKPPNGNGRADDDDENGWRALNTEALQNLDLWVPVLFGSKAKKTRKGGYRVSSKALGRKLVRAGLKNLNRTIGGVFA